MKTNYADFSARIREHVNRHAMSKTWPIVLAALRPSPLRPWKRVAGRAMPPRSDRHARVSVVIPCYNYGRFLAGAVESALRQSDVDVQVVIVNDASLDDTAVVAEQLASGDPRVIVVHNEKNLGHAWTFNRGLEYADGEFLVRLDADDLLTPGSLSRAVEVFDYDSSIGLVYGNPYHFTTPTPPRPRRSAISWTIWSGADWLAERCRLGVNCITTPEAMLRMSIVHTVGPLDTRLRYANDMEIWCRVAAVSAVGRVNGVDQALHREHPLSLSVTEAALALTDLGERRRTFELVFESTGATLPNAAELHSMAERVLAREALGYAERALDAGDQKLANRYLEFARDTAPSLMKERQPASIARRVQGASKRSLVRVFRRRLGGIGREFDYVRWAVHGV
ncbi:MAG: glycosyltransferase family 2 protein [Microbacterium sp.]